MFEKNNIYANNFNSYEKDSDVIPRVPIPVGTGILIAEGNADEMRGNRIWDNRRYGTMLVALPDVCRSGVVSRARRRTATATPRTLWAWRRRHALRPTAWTSGGTRRRAGHLLARTTAPPPPPPQKKGGGGGGAAARSAARLSAARRERGAAGHSVQVGPRWSLDSMSSIFVGGYDP